MAQAKEAGDFVVGFPFKEELMEVASQQIRFLGLNSLLVGGLEHELCIFPY